MAAGAKQYVMGMARVVYRGSLPKSHPAFRRVGVFNVVARPEAVKAALRRKRRDSDKK